MGVLRKWFRRTKTVLGFMGRRSRIAAAIAAILIVTGGLWLACQGGQTRFVPVMNEQFDETDLASAVQLLNSRDIPARAESGRLLAAADKLPQARSVLAYEGLLPHNSVSTFEQLAKESDIWSTSDQNDKRWQAAKMSALGKLISNFPPVRGATVLYEPGLPRRLGAGAVEPTASVKVVLKPNSAMDHKLVTAIADLISGSISGMHRQNVRIVDSTGQSYRVDDEGVLSADDRLEQLRAGEAFYREKIRSSLQYVPNVIVAARVEGEGAAMHCVGASISVPRSYFVTIYNASNGQCSTVSDDQLKPVIDPQLARIQQAVMRVVGCDDPAAVQADWHYDLPAEPAKSANVQAAPASSAFLTPAASCLAIAGVSGTGVLFGLALFLVYRRRRRGEQDSAPGMTGQLANDCVAGNRPDDAGELRDSFDFLLAVSVERVVEFLQAEHPQTGAMVLAHLPSDKSAEILQGLPRLQQVEITRRIASLERPDPQAVRDVARSAAERFAVILNEPRSSGVAIVARILHHVGGQTEQSILSDLSGDEPAMVDSIRRRLLAFEDIVHVPADQLRSTLDDFESDELAVALRTAADELKDKVLSSLSPAAAARVREEMERIGPVRLSDVEAAQQNVAQAVRRPRGQYVPTGSRRGELLA